MKCYYHPETDAALECRLCGHALCGTCHVEIRGVAYCRDCLATRVEPDPAPAAAAAPELRSVRAAGWLSVFPGLGLVYLGQYIKGLVVGLLFVAAIQFADQTEAAGFLIPFLWFGQIFYAVQEAKRLNRLPAAAAAAAAPVETASSSLEGKDSAIWGAILVGLGVFFLLDQFDLIRFGEVFEKFWPVLIIALGIQILLRGKRPGARPSDS
jgi:hypothetical protein